MADYKLDDDYYYNLIDPSEGIDDPFNAQMARLTRPVPRDQRAAGGPVPVSDVTGHAQGGITGINRVMPVTGMWGQPGYMGDLTGGGSNSVNKAKSDIAEARKALFEPPPMEPTPLEQTPYTAPREDQSAPPPAPSPAPPTKLQDRWEEPPLPEVTSGKSARSDDGPKLPQASTPTQVADPRPSLPSTPTRSGMFGLQEGSGLDKLFSGLNNWRDQNRMQLMMLAGGMMQSHGKGDWSGAGRGLMAAAQTVPQQNALNNQNATMQALINRGVPPDEARAAAGNPALMQQIMPHVFGGKQLKWTKVGSDMSGNDVMGWVDEVSGTRYDRNGRQIGVSAGGNTPSVGTPGTPGTSADTSETSGYELPEGALATGVKQFNPALSGDDFLNQFNPVLRSGIQAYIDGDSKVMNARQKGDQRLIQNLAKMWGQNSGQEVTDNDFTEKSGLINDAKKTAPNTFGGQRINGNTAMEHLSTLSDIMVQLNNSGYGYFPGLSHLMNQWKQTGSTEQKALANAYEDAVDKYVNEVGKYYSGSSTGGVGEREEARRRLSSTLTPQEFAQLLRTERDLFTGKLGQLQQTRDQVYRGDTARADRMVGPVMRPETMGRIANIERNIGTLRGQGGGTPGAAQAPAAPQRPPVRTATNPQTGQRLADYGDGKWVPMQ